MNHNTMRTKMLRYLDDELSDQEYMEMRRHLEHCENCRDALRTIESMWSAERPIERITAPPYLWMRISAQLQEEAEEGFLHGLKESVRPALRPVATVVVLLFMFFSGITLGNLMTGSTGDDSRISAAGGTDTFQTSYFEILPPGSINAHVLVLNESEMEE